MTLPTGSGRYRNEAARLREKAETTQDLTIRAELVAMARQYEVLADSVERREPDRTSWPLRSWL